MTDSQIRDQLWKPFFKERDPKREIYKVIIEETEVLVKDQNRLVVPTALHARVLQWYHHYLQHPGISRLEETLIAVMYWPGLGADVKILVKSCKRCQKGKRRAWGYGKVPPKTPDQVPWRKICVDLIDPYTLKDQTGKIVDFMCLIIINPATG